MAATPGSRAAAAADKRRQILDAAIRVFARQGFHACRVSDVADEAGVAYGLVYHYFQSKEEIMATLFTGPVFTNYGGLIANQRFQPVGFAAPLGEKDIRLALAAAETLRVPMPLASLVHDRLQALIARGGEQLDWSALGQLAAQDAGLR